MSAIRVKDPDVGSERDFEVMINLIKNVSAHLEKNDPIILATIISHTGSAPRKTGSKMIVTPDRTIEGSIGGGILEARVIQKASANFQTHTSEVICFDLTADDAAAMGMVCGGEIDVLLDLVLPTEENRTLFSRWTEEIQNKQGSFFLTVVPLAPVLPKNVSHCIWTPKGIAAGALPKGNNSANELLRILGKQKSTQMITINGVSILVEPAIVPKGLYIFGAGHVAIPTAAFAAKVGFDVCVMDDRVEFVDSGRFPVEVDARAIAGFDQAFSDISVDDQDFIVIVTRGHLHDQVVLAQALKTDAAYIGMIGSKKKRDTIYKALLNEGFTPDDIDRVNCPIGLDIKAQTPEEIAVSIVAELIEKRASLKS